MHVEVLFLLHMKEMKHEESLLVKSLKTSLRFAKSCLMTFSLLLQRLSVVFYVHILLSTVYCLLLYICNFIT